MRIEVLNTGSELLLGTTMNTHGGWFGQELFKLGLRVQRQTTVPDGDAIRVALEECVGRSDVVLVTGGLGPTSDDITREATSAVLGVELIEDEAAMRSLEEFFAKRGYEMAPENYKQAQVPVGADVLPNPNGTAPGIYVPPRLNGAANCAVFLLPGPPRELYPLFKTEVVPRLKGLSGGETAERVLELKLTGVGESTVHHEVDEELAGVSGLEVGYCARVSEVDVRLIGRDEAIARGREIVLGRFSAQCFAEDGSSLEQVVVTRFTEKRLKLAVAESCTGGLIANRITNVPGSSAVLTHGFVTYANEAKREVLGVSEEDLAEHGAVSEVVARQMAEGALRVASSDVAVSVTGIAGPGGGSEEKPVGTVFLGVAVKGGETRVVKDFYVRDRAGFKWSVSQKALDLLRLAKPVKVEQTSGLLESGSASGGPVFRPFAKEGPEVAKARRRLPHWRQDGRTYFVTFRTADSLPKDVMGPFLARRDEWLRLKGIEVLDHHPVELDRLSFEDRREYDRIFVKALQSELDRGHGACLLGKKEHARTVQEAFEFFDGERYVLGDFVIMPNHVHVLLVPTDGHELSDILKSWKSFTAKAVNRAESQSGRFWQSESWDHIVRSRRQLERFQDYIAENPKMAGLGQDEVTARRVEWEFE
ncbi:MAG: competence/damage-inducible protein A [Verrucomicrobiota bacterium]